MFSADMRKVRSCRDWCSAVQKP
uniref:Uncharacterized protein n=1 Tax=Nelumbo nucifera TaxID=4432 RepID=A0A822XTE6_NELNU|nr:TPA_asm: hypothetical protein HUJ06_024755 [Nelumbo nucifera]